ncbi:MAG: ABC transporter ATP-binding protein [Gammaproteobacteria bacterium]|nr:ABC transporter ATP-binding protein [Gammaproteobacteria bacterium]
MSSDPIIQVEHLSKCYHIYRQPIDRIKQGIWKERKRFFREFWALRDVSFDVERGDSVGIIGQNGSGKSTLLELISGTLTPTSGKLKVDGRVAALLQLGAGFNPEFTGKENVCMNAAIMGLSQSELDSRYTDILSFSEIEDFIDQPIKTYSSGMYVRLAFSVAINMDPDILVVDEALSVGDARFQRKCFRKFHELKERGKTILFVTHSTELINAHCDKALFLDHGKLREIGRPREVVHSYLNFLFGNKQSEPAVRCLPREYSSDARRDDIGMPIVLNTDPNVDGCSVRPTYNPSEYRWGNQTAKIIDYMVKCGDKRDPVLCPKGEEIEVIFVVYFLEKIDGLIYGITIKTVDGITVYGSNTRSRDIGVSPKNKNERVILSFSIDAHLIPGVYFVSLGVAVDDPDIDASAVDRRYDLFQLNIEGNNADFGIADLRMRFKEIPDPAAFGLDG